MACSKENKLFFFFLGGGGLFDYNFPWKYFSYMKGKSELLCIKNMHPFYFTIGILSPLGINGSWGSWGFCRLLTPFSDLICSACALVLQWFVLPNTPRWFGKKLFPNQRGTANLSSAKGRSIRNVMGGGGGNFPAAGIVLVIQFLLWIFFRP